MSYDADELFEFRRVDDGYVIVRYLKTDDPTITELEIPAEYNGLPVVKLAKCAVFWRDHIKRVIIPGSVREILTSAFAKCSSLEEVDFSEGLELISNDAFSHTALKRVKLPKSLKAIYSEAFAFCENLEQVEFNSAPKIELNVFTGCATLPPETVVMGLVRSFDITKPIYSNKDFLRMTSKGFSTCLDCFRPDVFALLVRNDCFINCDLEYLFERMIKEDSPELFRIAAQESAELLDVLLNHSIERQRTEITAYLLDLKRRKFGFNGGDNFEL